MTAFVHDLRGEGADLVHFLLAALGAHERLHVFERGFAGIDVTAQSNHGLEPFLDPLLAHSGEPLRVGSSLWIRGFGKGFFEGFLEFTIAEVDWFEYLGEVQDSEEVEEISYLDERLFSLMVLSGDAQAAALEHHEEWPEGEELKTLENECQEELSHVILDIYKFWSALRNTSGFIEESIQSETADDCPCGSGKKFGQCCGIN